MLFTHICCDSVIRIEIVQQKYKRSYSKRGIVIVALIVSSTAAFNYVTIVHTLDRTNYPFLLFHQGTVILALM